MKSVRYAAEEAEKQMDTFKEAMELRAADAAVNRILHMSDEQILKSAEREDHSSFLGQVLQHIEENRHQIVLDGDPDLDLDGYAVTDWQNGVIASGANIHSALQEYFEKHMSDHI